MAGRSEGLQFEASPGKKLVRPPSHPIAGSSGICLSSKARRVRSGRLWFQASLAGKKKVHETTSQRKKTGWVWYVCHHSYDGKHK
jgi:hypothetical protein